MIESEEKNKVYVSVRNLVEFILRSGDIDNRKKSSADLQSMLEGGKIHRLIQGKMGPDYHAEVFLGKSIDCGEYDICIEGRADGIICANRFFLETSKSNTEKNETAPEGTVTIDEIKCTYLELDKLSKPKEVHLAQAKCYAFIFAEEYGIQEITVRMTYCNITTMELKYFHETYTYSEIRKWFMELLEKYRRWADFEFSWKKIRNESIMNMEFPFEYRNGQKELVTDVYKTIYHSRKLFLEAPTGVGKTISTVFPSIKAVGVSLADKIFYLTAKTITATVAAECFETLRNRALKFKTVVITAKEKICPNEEAECNPAACEMAGGHYDRINDAIYDVLVNEDSFDRETIIKYGIKHKVCPFELGLDLSLFADAIVCDYNYVFDPNVYLRRFFGETVSGRYVFLVDEAHNLVERGIEMYSATLYKEKFPEMKHIVKDVDARLSRNLGRCNRKLLEYKRECDDFLVLDDISDFVMALSTTMSRLDTFLDENDNFKQRDELLEFYFELRHFLNMFDNMGEDDYRIYCEHTYTGDFMIKLLCINPSDSLKRRLEKSRSTIFFSATLLPVNYFRDMLGGNVDDYAVYAKTIFDSSRRGLFIASDVSSKYTRRNDTEYYNIASYISKITTVKSGNYMVFFPSHAFLLKVYECYEKYFEDDKIEIVVQRASMNEKEREEFLNRFDVSAFEKKENATLIGFCVLGGIFSEGIDLKRDSLIGAIIVGTGLPLVCNQRELLKTGYEENGLGGFDYAYRFPGMNKVLQAVGRVIRTEEDKGVVVLLDERFLLQTYRKLFPREWKNYEVCRLDNIAAKIEEFWEMFEDEQPGVSTYH